MSGVVVVGAGQAGFQVAASLREGGYADPITLIGEEAALPYQRPPLSKGYLTGKVEAQGLPLRPAAYLAEHRIAHRAQIRATRVDRASRSVHLSDGTSLAYDHLVLATGSRNRTLPVPGAGLAGVHQLRSLDEAEAIRGALAGAGRIVVVGAGFIGLEVAAVCAARGLDVTVIEAADRPMARAVSAGTGSWFRAAHEEAGIRFVLEAGVTAFAGAGGRVAAVATADGRELPADLVLVGIGVAPNEEIAAAAGLATGDGVRVDAFLATADPAVSAIGDCARFPSRFARGLAGGDHVRIESVQNAVDHGRCVAARIGGRPNAYDAVPWFWSDQGRHKLQIAGLAGPGDAGVMRGGPGAFSVFRYRDGRLCAVESVNRPGDHMAARRILALGLTLAPEQAADPNLDLRALTAPPPRP